LLNDNRMRRDKTYMNDTTTNNTTKPSSSSSSSQPCSIVYPKIINHIAVSVPDQDQAIKWYKEDLNSL
jgi:hypothetical protein